MILITIGSSQRNLKDASESWIREQIDRRRTDGQLPCVRVEIQSDGVNVALSTPDCTNPVGATRPPKAAEHRIFQLWNLLHLNSPKYSAENVIDFLKRVMEWI